MKKARFAEGSGNRIIAKHGILKPELQAQRREAAELRQAEMSGEVERLQAGGVY